MLHSHPRSTWSFIQRHIPNDIPKGITTTRGRCTCKADAEVGELSAAIPSASTGRWCDPVDHSTPQLDATRGCGRPVVLVRVAGRPSSPCAHAWRGFAAARTSQLPKVHSSQAQAAPCGGIGPTAVHATEQQLGAQSSTSIVERFRRVSKSLVLHQVLLKQN